MLALRVSTLFNVVRNAAITAIAKTVVKIANTVRWVIGLPMPTDYADRLDRFLPRGQFFEGISTLAGLQRERISELASDRKHSVASQGRSRPQ
jgi:hypothetical protein